MHSCIGHIVSCRLSLRVKALVRLIQKFPLDLEDKLSYLRDLKFFIMWSSISVISGEDVSVPAQFAHVTGWLAFRSWLSRISWRWLVRCGCIIITLSLMACHSDPSASAQQNRPREETSSPKETSPPKQVKVARVLDTPL